VQSLLAAEFRSVGEAVSEEALDGAVVRTIAEING